MSCTNCKTLNFTDETVAVLVQTEDYRKFQNVLTRLRCPPQLKEKILILRIKPDEKVVAIDEKEMNRLGWFKK